MLDKSLFIRALNKENLETPPIWYMRQAGRYMPEYREVRKKFNNFMDMCKNPDVCCELAMQPINEFKLDASILFSDILTIPDAFNLGVSFVEGKGPVFSNPIKTNEDVDNLPEFDPNDLDYVYKAVKNIRATLPEDIPLIGFCGSPWTLAAYSIEGSSSKSFSFTKNFIVENEKAANIFLKKLTNACFLYLKEQVIAGANAIQIFDSWANLLSEKEYKKWSLQYIDELIELLKNDQVTANVPVILFAREPECSSSDLIETSADCISLFWTMRTPNLDLMKNKVAIQGNLNPAILLESNKVIKEEAYKILDLYKDYPGYIFNLGHGITPNISPDKVKYLTQLVREY